MERKELLSSREYWITNIQLGLFELIENFGKENKLNKTQIGDKLGYSKSYVSQILNGNFDHKISKFVDISLALGKVPILKYEDLQKYIMHDSLNISTVLAKEINWNLDVSHHKPSDNVVKVDKGFTSIPTNNHIKMRMSLKDQQTISTANCE